MELLTARLLRWAGVRSRGALLVVTLLLLLRGATVPGGSQCWSGPGSGVPGKDVFSYVSEVSENAVIKKVNNNNNNVFISCWCLCGRTDRRALNLSPVNGPR